MIPLLAGAVLLWVGSLLVREFLQASPAAMAQRIKQGGGVVFLLFALLLLMRGQIGLGLGMGGIGAWAMTGRHPALRVRKRPGQARGAGGGRLSRVRSATIEMELDHATGVMRGTILAGPEEGWQLDALDRKRLGVVYDFCLSADHEGARLLEAYFDRRFPGWREAAQDQGDSRHRAASGGGGRQDGRMSRMSEDEARELLGLPKGASRDDVARAHRAVMKRAHPDHGGSTDLAARVNEAKDVLMRRHQ